MERKLNQEKALREVAETRVKALKKKIRVYEGASGTNHHTTTGSSTANANDTSMDAGYGAAGAAAAGVSSVTRGDDESVGTNQTYDNNNNNNKPS